MTRVERRVRELLETRREVSLTEAMKFSRGTTGEVAKVLRKVAHEKREQ